MGGANTWIPVITLIIGLIASPVLNALSFLLLRAFKQKDEKTAYRRQAMLDAQAALLRLQQAKFEHTQLPDPLHGEEAHAVMKEAIDAHKQLRFHAVRLGNEEFRAAVAELDMDDLPLNMAPPVAFDEVGDVLAELMAKEW